MKKLISLIISLGVILAEIPSFAETEKMEPAWDLMTGGVSSDCTVIDCGDLEFDKPKKLMAAFRNVEEETYNRIKYAMKNRTSTAIKIDEKDYYDLIDVHDLGFSQDDERKLLDIYRSVVFDTPEVPAYTGVTFFEGNGKIYYFQPVYLCSREKDIEYEQLMNEKIDEYIALTEDIPDDDVLGKLLVIHDAFACECAYAWEEWKRDDDNRIYSAYGAFVNNRAVCQGNAIALQAIFRELNKRLMEKTGAKEDIIKSALCESNEERHMWNCVKLGGKWYHIDETYDDPVFMGDDGKQDVMNGCLHDCFLVSDSTLLTKGDIHGSGSATDWNFFSDEEVVCNDDMYEKGYIFNGDSRCKYAPSGRTGGYHGKISYDKTRYKIDIYKIPLWYDNYKAVKYPSVDFKPFYSNTVSSPGMIASEPYQTENSKKAVSYWVNGIDDITADIIIARYEDRTLDMSKKLNSTFIAGRENGVIIPDDGNLYKCFLWQTGTMMPVCEAR